MAEGAWALRAPSCLSFIIHSIAGPWVLQLQLSSAALAARANASPSGMNLLLEVSHAGYYKCWMWQEPADLWRRAAWAEETDTQGVQSCPKGPGAPNDGATTARLHRNTSAHDVYAAVNVVAACCWAGPCKVSQKLSSSRSSSSVGGLRDLLAVLQRLQCSQHVTLQQYARNS